MGGVLLLHCSGVCSQWACIWTHSAMACVCVTSLCCICMSFITWLLAVASRKCLPWSPKTEWALYLLVALGFLAMYSWEVQCLAGAQLWYGSWASCSCLLVQLCKSACSMAVTSTGCFYWVQGWKDLGCCWLLRIAEHLLCYFGDCGQWPLSICLATVFDSKTCMCRSSVGCLNSTLSWNSPLCCKSQGFYLPLGKGVNWLIFACVVAASSTMVHFQCCTPWDWLAVRSASPTSPCLQKGEGISIIFC